MRDGSEEWQREGAREQHTKTETKQNKYYKVEMKKGNTWKKNRQIKKKGKEKERREEIENRKMREG